MGGGAGGGGGGRWNRGKNCRFRGVLSPTLFPPLLSSLFHRFFQRLKYSFASVPRSPRVISFPFPLPRVSFPPRPFHDPQSSKAMAREARERARSVFRFFLSVLLAFRRENSKQRWESKRKKKVYTRFLPGFCLGFFRIWRVKGVKRVLWLVNDRVDREDERRKRVGWFFCSKGLLFVLIFGEVEKINVKKILFHDFKILLVRSIIELLSEYQGGRIRECRIYI